MIEVRELRKTYRGGAVALDGVSLTVRRGEIFGLVGADGAGKTTAFQILAGVLPSTSGEVIGPGREKIGYLTQQLSLYQDLSVIENLRFSAGLRHVHPADFEDRRKRYLTRFDMARFEDRLAGRLSGGMKQKLALACALVASPEVLLLDEPTTGVDPVSRREFWDALAELAAEGMTILVATASVEEAERCHRVALIERGRILESGAPAELRAAMGADATLEDVFVETLRKLRGGEVSASLPGRRSRAESRGEILLDARNLHKRFGSFVAVKDFTLQIRRGEVYGLLGANGAGKTTAIKMMCGLLEPARGSVALLGRTRGLRSAEVRSRIGYMSQKFTLYDDLTIGENLDFYARLYGVPGEVRRARRQWVLDVSELAGQEGLLTAQLPGGWKQRVAFGCAVMHEPDLIFLDEPTSGVDPLARRAMWRMIRELADTGSAILVVTHYLEEAEQCAGIGFMVAGEILLDGPPAEVRRAHPGCGSLEDVFIQLIEQRSAA